MHANNPAPHFSLNFIRKCYVKDTSFTFIAMNHSRLYLTYYEGGHYGYVGKDAWDGLWLKNIY